MNAVNEKRLLAFFAVVYLILGFLFMRVFSIQIIYGEKYMKYAESNREQVLPIPARRGEIYDRNGIPIAVNKKSVNVFVIPAYLPKGTKREKVFKKLSKVLGVGVGEIKELIERQKSDPYMPVVIFESVGFDKLTRIAEHIDEYQGVFWDNMPKRFYPFREVFAHVVGYTGIISKAEFKKLKPLGRYHIGSIVGKTGIEKQYDYTLRGIDGSLNRIVDAHNRVISQRVGKVPVAGNNLILTVDADLQQVAYDLLGDRRGAVVVSKPATGEILVMVSKPSYDPNLFISYRVKEYLKLLKHPDKPFLNRAIQAIYPPSSIFKLIVATAFLANGGSVKHTEFCPGHWKLGNRDFKCWEVHHTQDFYHAIANSCDVYFYKVGYSLGPQTIIDFAFKFGFGKRTGIDIPGEISGLVPTLEWHKKVYKTPWLAGNTLNMSIGQGDLLVTPLQINTATALIFNDGTVYKPHLLKEVKTFDNSKVVKKTGKEVLIQVDVPKRIFEEVKKGMNLVTEIGTASFLHYYTKIKIAGKTGTAQAGKDKEDHSWFTCYAPADYKNPEDVIAVTVIAENSGSGAAVAAPIAAQIVDKYFKLMEERKSAVAWK